jgi:hypothetical protein
MQNFLSRFWGCRYRPAGVDVMSDVMMTLQLFYQHEDPSLFLVEAPSP